MVDLDAYKLASLLKFTQLKNIITSSIQ